MTRRKNKKKNSKVLIIFLFLIILGIGGYYLYQKNLIDKELLNKTLEKAAIKASYNEYVITKTETNLYNSNYEIAGKVSEDMYLELSPLEDNYDYESPYFKLKNLDLYIKYTDIKKSDIKEYDTRYKNYIPFNKNIKVKENTKIYLDESTYYEISSQLEFPIIINEEDRYYIEYDNKLVYVLKDQEVEEKESDNNSEPIATGIPILNYHFVINLEAGEGPLCEPASICHTDTQFDSHIEYIKNNNFYSITMKELEMFLDNKINLPKKSVSITIDDGWFVGRSIPILEKYDVMATLFLIGSLAPVSDYASKNLEVHSHTWDLHNVSNCQEGRSALLCLDKAKLVTDLKQSRESLNNTTYFCYPFYEYNNHAIEALKEAGFTMALTGGNKRATKGIDKYKVPRYVIYNTTTVNELANIIN